MGKKKYKCVICLKTFDTEKSLHFHLRSHGIKTKEYYEKYFPKFDLLTGEKIEFKNVESYKKKYFLSATNFRLWRNSSESYEVQKFCKKLFEERKADGKIRYSPSEVELRSLMWPSVQESNEIFGDYYEFCSNIGLINKFKNYQDIEKPEPDDDYTIYVDTREQRPLKFESLATKVHGLKFGDYCRSDEKESGSPMRIERKSLADFVSTLSPKNYDRFKREIMKAADNNCFLVVLVESVFANAMSFKREREIGSKERIHKATKMNPGYILKRMRDLCQEFSHIQFLFVDGRDESSRVMKEIFSNTWYYSQLDLQYMYDTSKL